MMKNTIKLSLIMPIFFTCNCFAQETNMLTRNVGWGYDRPYINEDGTRVGANWTTLYGWGLTIRVNKYAANNYNYIGDEGYIRINVTINGQTQTGTTPSVYYTTYDFDENGRLKAWYNDTGYAGHNGELLQTYEYADNGQMLVYNQQGQLIGAYNNWADMFLARTNAYDKKTELNHISEDGTYIVKDANNNVLELYSQNGGYTKNKYNTNGELISSSKYDKAGNIKESSSYKYDGGGNIVQQYQNGKLIYLRKIYTPAEAAAAVHDGNDNVVSITW